MGWGLGTPAARPYPKSWQVNIPLPRGPHISCNLMMSPIKALKGIIHLLFTFYIVNTTPYYRLSRQQMQSGTQKINKLNEI